MTLEDYITEAVSHGWHKTAADYPEKLDPRSVANWLMDLGIDDIYQFGQEYGDNDPPVSPGKVVGFTGPCNPDQEGTFWVAVYNNTGRSGTEWTQELVLWTEGDKKGRLDTRHGKEYDDISVKDALELMKWMVYNPRKKVVWT